MSRLAGVSTIVRTTVALAFLTIAPVSAAMAGETSAREPSKAPARFDNHHFLSARGGVSVASSLDEVPADLDPGYGFALEYGYEVRFPGSPARAQIGLGFVAQSWTGARGPQMRARADHMSVVNFLRGGAALGRLDVLGGVAFGYGYLSQSDSSLPVGPRLNEGRGLAVAFDLRLQLRLGGHFSIGAFSSVGLIAVLGRSADEDERVAPIPPLGATFGLSSTVYL